MEKYFRNKQPYLSEILYSLDDVYKILYFVGVSSNLQIEKGLPIPKSTRSDDPEVIFYIITETRKNKHLKSREHKT